MLARSISLFVLLFLLIGTAAPAISMADDSCSPAQDTSSITISIDDCGHESEKDKTGTHGPCNCPIHHKSCCQAQFFLKAPVTFQGWSAEQPSFFSVFTFSFTSPTLEGPFQPPKA